MDAKSQLCYYLNDENKLKENQASIVDQLSIIFSQLSRKTLTAVVKYQSSFTPSDLNLLQLCIGFILDNNIILADVNGICIPDPQIDEKTSQTETSHTYITDDLDHIDSPISTVQQTKSKVDGSKLPSVKTSQIETSHTYITDDLDHFDSPISAVQQTKSKVDGSKLPSVKTPITECPNSAEIKRKHTFSCGETNFPVLKKILDVDQNNDSLTKAKTSLNTGLKSKHQRKHNSSTVNGTNKQGRGINTSHLSTVSAFDLTPKKVCVPDVHCSLQPIPTSKFDSSKDVKQAPVSGTACVNSDKSLTFGGFVNRIVTESRLTPEKSAVNVTNPQTISSYCLSLPSTFTNVSFKLSIDNNSKVITPQACVRSTINSTDITVSSPTIGTVTRNYNKSSDSTSTTPDSAIGTVTRNYNKSNDSTTTAPHSAIGTVATNYNKSYVVSRSNDSTTTAPHSALGTVTKNYNKSYVVSRSNDPTTTTTGTVVAPQSAIGTVATNYNKSYVVSRSNDTTTTPHSAFGTVTKNYNQSYVASRSNDSTTTAPHSAIGTVTTNYNKSCVVSRSNDSTTTAPHPAFGTVTTNYNKSYVVSRSNDTTTTTTGTVATHLKTVTTPLKQTSKTKSKSPVNVTITTVETPSPHVNFSSVSAPAATTYIDMTTSNMTSNNRQRTEVLQLFPTADPDYIDELLLTYTGVTAVNDVCSILIDNPNYPKIFSNTEAIVISPVKKSPEIDYYKNVFESDNWTGVSEQLANDFRMVSMKDINNIMKKCNKSYAQSHRALSKAFQAAIEGNPYKRIETIVVTLLPDTGSGSTMVCRLLKHRRCERYRSPIPELQKEIEFVKYMNAKEKVDADAEVARKLNEEQYAESGDNIECGCCYGEQPFENMVQCYEGHLFCKTCLQSYVREAVFGSGKLDLSCMTDGCNSSFPESQYQCLAKDVLEKYEDRVREENLNLADIEDLVRCPCCDYAAILDPGDKVFRCQNINCLKETCRFCKEEWKNHIGIPCKELEKKDETTLRKEYEEKMTAAKVRTCPKCKSQFMKDGGCNKMTCRCCATMCYVCRKPMISYEHFCQHPRDPGFNCKTCTACSLWSNPEEDDKRAVSEIQQEAQKIRREKGYLDDKVIGAPDEPPAKKARVK